MVQNSLSAEQEINKYWPSKKMTHLWTSEEGVRACHIQFVPQRVILAPTGEIVQWWDGSHGNVVDLPYVRLRHTFLDYVRDRTAANI